MKSFQAELQNRWASIKSYFGSPVVAVLGIAVLIFGITVFQRACDRRAIENQTAEIKRYEAETQATRERTEQLLQLFETQHQSTVSILDAMTNISGTINNLVANDRAFDVKVNDLKQNYESSKNPIIVNKTVENQVVRDARARRRNLPLRQREADALSDDAELYPNSNGFRRDAPRQTN